jgi:hypothetical protein
LAPTNEKQVLQQIQEAWKVAQRQLTDLRAAVERHGELAELRGQGEVLTRALDRAYRDLGEAVWSQVKKGKLELPAAVAPAVKAILLVEQKQAARASSIQDLLAEGAEVAGKLRAAKKPATKTVAAKGKKR